MSIKPESQSIQWIADVNKNMAAKKSAYFISKIQ